MKQNPPNPPSPSRQQPFAAEHGGYAPSRQVKSNAFSPCNLRGMTVQSYAGGVPNRGRRRIFIAYFSAP